MEVKKHSLGSKADQYIKENYHKSEVQQIALDLCALGFVRKLPNSGRISEVARTLGLKPKQIRRRKYQEIVIALKAIIKMIETYEDDSSPGH